MNADMSWRDVDNEKRSEKVSRKKNHLNDMWRQILKNSLSYKIPSTTWDHETIVEKEAEILAYPHAKAMWSYMENEHKGDRKEVFKFFVLLTLQILNILGNFRPHHGKFFWTSAAPWVSKSRSRRLISGLKKFVKSSVNIGSTCMRWSEDWNVGTNFRWFFFRHPGKIFMNYSWKIVVRKSGKFKYFGLHFYSYNDFLVQIFVY